MNVRDFLDRYAGALDVQWRTPPADASRAARTKPPGSPVDPVPDRVRGQAIPAADVRAAVTSPGGGMATRSFPGVDVTLMVTPPDGDGLWQVRGRAWRNPSRPRSIRVVLASDENVLGETTIEDGGRFEFDDVLFGEWSLELHLGEGDVAVLNSGPS